MGVTGRDKVAFAREQRRQATPAETQLWLALRRQALGAKFRRQHPIGDCVLDFYCKEQRLAIEVDGAIHKGQAEYDEWRDKQLSECGIRTVRFTDTDVLEDLPKVLAAIKAALRHTG